MKKQFDIKKLVLLNLPYLLMGLFATNFGEAWRLSQGANASEKFLSLFAVLPGAMQSFWPSLHPLDLLVGLCCGAGLRLAVYLKSKNAKKYRHGLEYGSARWGTREDIEDLERRVSEHSAATESLKKTLDEQTARMKAIKQLYDSSAAFQSWKPVYDGLQKIKFEKPRAKYKAEHEAELKQFYAARRKLTGEFPDGKVDMKKLTEEYDELEQAHNTTYGEFKTVRDDLHRLWKVKSCVDTAARFNERTEEQKLQNRPQTRHKKEDMTR